MLRKNKKLPKDIKIINEIIHPDNLIKIKSSPPGKEWISLFLLYMFNESMSSFTLQKSSGIPPIPLEDEISEGELSFDKIINRLKVMCELDPVAYKKTHEGSFPVTVHGKNYTIKVTFFDTAADPSYKIQITEKQS
jgi:hypothetical protein